MRIAMIAPLSEAVPPPRYGGTERVVAALTEELVRRGHDVTLFASGDSETSACLVSCCDESLRSAGHSEYLTGLTLMQLARVYGRAAEFDVIHNHIDALGFPFARASRARSVVTVHYRPDLPHMQEWYQRFAEQAWVSISDAQRATLPHGRWMGTVYHGIDVSRFHFVERSGDYLVFLGRMAPEKGPDRAIAIARATGMRLIMAAKVDSGDRDYYERCVAPLIRSCSLVEYSGEVDDREKDTLLGNAYAYLFPIDWPEPFGLTMAEAMATGTPVIAMRRGSVPEVVVDGETGLCATA